MEVKPTKPRGQRAWGAEGILVAFAGQGALSNLQMRFGLTFYHLKRMN